MTINKIKKILFVIRDVLLGLCISVIFATFLLGILGNLNLIYTNLNAIVYTVILLLLTTINMIFYLKFEKYKQISNKIFSFVATIFMVVIAIKTYIPKFTIDFIRDAAISVKTKDIEASDWLAYFGSVYGALIGAILSFVSALGLSLILKQMDKKESREEQNRLVKLIVEEFLGEEIEDNLNIMKCMDVNIRTYLTGNFTKYDERQDSWPEFININMEKYEKYKDQLIKYDCEIVFKTIKKYKLFRILKETVIPNASNIKKLNESDFNILKKLLKEFYL